MNKSFRVISFLLCINSFGQSIETRFVLNDKDGSTIDYLYLVIDDSIYLQPDLDFELVTSLVPGLHDIKCDLYGYSVIDTLIRVSETDTLIELKTDIVNDAYMNEFNSSDFEKIYTNPENLPIIGLKADNTFMMKSFFHVSIVGCFQIEKGIFELKNDTLILKVEDYDCPCLKTPEKIEHTYRFSILNDSIVDLDKYFGFIEKKYMGHGLKEFDE